MSDSVIQGGAEEGAPASSWATPGGLLRQARLHAGVQVDTLAAALKVPVYKLEALEEDRLEVFPDVVFVRALASSICRTLKVDATPVLELLPQGQAPRLSADNGINASFKDGHGARKVTSASLAGGPSGPRWIPAVVAVLLLAALALVFLPRGLEWWRGSQDASAVESSSSSAGALPAGMVEEPAAAPSALTAPSATAGGADATAAPVAAPMGGASAEAALPTPVAPVPALAGGEVLVVRARGETWVQIRNLVGGSSVQRVLQAGDSLVAQGEPPWAVVIGKAAMTDVLVRGERLDLTTIARDNVARFEVK